MSHPKLYDSLGKGTPLIEAIRFRVASMAPERAREKFTEERRTRFVQQQLHSSFPPEKPKNRGRRYVLVSGRKRLYLD